MVSKYPFWLVVVLALSACTDSGGTNSTEDEGDSGSTSTSGTSESSSDGSGGSTTVGGESSSGVDETGTSDDGSGTTTSGTESTADTGESGGPATVHLGGGVDKGPFVLGSSIAVSTLDASGAPTGDVFNTETTSDLGEFEVDVMGSGYVSIEADGFYFNEVTGALSGAQLTLRAYVELGSSSTQDVHVNLLTHLSYGRVKTLLDDGASFADAVAQAESELRIALGIGPADFDPGASGASLSLIGGDTLGNAYLLAVGAVLLQAAILEAGTGGPVEATFQELVNTLGSDLAADGLLEADSVAQVRAAEAAVDGDAIMANLAARLDETGSSAAVPNPMRVLDPDEDDLAHIGDNCDFVANPDQEDGDTNGVGNACDPRWGSCERVDVLFVVDNSDDTLEERAELATQAPIFVAAVQDALATTDVRSMVVTTGFIKGVGSTSCSAGDCTCSDEGEVYCCVSICAQDYMTCNDYDCDALPPVECEYSEGTGQRSGASGDCGLPADAVYVNGQDTDALDQIACLANPGPTGPADEAPAESLMNALAFSMTGGCNEGFVRPASTLVVVLVTNEEDDPDDADGDVNSIGDPASWRQTVLGVKREQAVVMLGILGDLDLGSPLCVADDQSEDHGEPSPRLRTFVESFANHATESACAADFGPLFADAADLVAEACDD